MLQRFEPRLRSASIVSQHLHDFFVLFTNSDLQRRATARLEGFVKVCASLDQRGHYIIVSILSSNEKRGAVFRRRDIQIRTGLYQIHDNKCVAFLSGDVQSRMHGGRSRVNV